MKNLQSIIANLVVLAIIAACSKKSSSSEIQIANPDLEKQNFQFNQSNLHFEANDFLIDERPYYEL